MSPEIVEVLASLGWSENLLSAVARAAKPLQDVTVQRVEIQRPSVGDASQSYVGGAPFGATYFAATPPRGQLGV